MKPMFESQETFEAHAAIEYCYWRIKQLGKELNKSQSPLDQMIDDATGYGDKVYQGHKAETIELLESVIENKKIIEADYSGDAEFLEKIKVCPPVR